MSEKTAIERATAEGFIVLYNQAMGTDYQVIEVSDSPDARCANSSGEPLNIEITLTEDEPGDIQAALGRSEKRSLEARCEHLQKVAAGLEVPKIYSLTENVSDIAMKRIRSKIKKRYGPNTALVVRDSSGVDWDWDLAAEKIKADIKSEANPFDRGIWILSHSKDRLFRIV